MFETLKNFLQPQQRSNFQVVTVNSSLDYESLPKGFFRVIAASGKESRGYNGGFLSWQVGTTVVDGGQRITCDIPLSELQPVRLNFQRSQCDGVQRVAGCSVIDTESLDADTTVHWDGAKPASGVAWV